MSSFIVERDAEFARQAVVVELSEDDDVNGQVVGWATGEDAMDAAAAVAAYIDEHGEQPPESMCDELCYTVKIKF